MDWDEVLNRKSLVGGDIRIEEHGTVYRGPLSKIRDTGIGVEFSTEWVAELTSRGWEARKGIPSTIFVNKDASTPSEIGEGRIHFRIPRIGFAIIFPKGRSNLNPRKVIGL